ncbi:5604_t:CDS:2, partial [Gigaspora rosea]
NSAQLGYSSPHDNVYLLHLAEIVEYLLCYYIQCHTYFKGLSGLDMMKTQFFLFDPFVNSTRAVAISCKSSKSPRKNSKSFSVSNCLTISTKLGICFSPRAFLEEAEAGVVEVEVTTFFSYF